MSTRRINLLPEEALQVYHKGRRATVIARIIGGLAVLALLVVVFVGSAAAYLKMLTDADRGRLTVVEGSQELKRAGELEGLISGFAQELVVLRDLKVKQYDPSFLVREIINVQPEGVTLQRFVLDFTPNQDLTQGTVTAANTAGAAPQVSLQGIAATRGDVLDFQHALEAFDFVESIDAPTQNIIFPENAHFSFELTLFPAAVAQRVKIDASENAGAENAPSDQEAPVPDATPAETTPETGGE